MIHFTHNVDRGFRTFVFLKRFVAFILYIYINILIYFSHYFNLKLYIRIKNNVLQSHQFHYYCFFSNKKRISRFIDVGHTVIIDELVVIMEIRHFLLEILAIYPLKSLTFAIAVALIFLSGVRVAFQSVVKIIFRTVNARVRSCEAIHFSAIV